MTAARWRAAVLAAAVALAACGRPAEKAAAPAPADDDRASAALPVRGLVVKTGDTYSIRPCGAPAGRALNVIDAPGALAAAFASLDAAAGVGIYAEIRGTTSTDGGSLTMTELVRARSLDGRLACEAPVFAGDFIASGNEPFWSVEIREDGIVFRTPGEPKGTTYPYAITRTETGASIYATKVEHPRVSTLEVALTPGRCVDSMSGEIRAFRARVVRDGAKLEGCAAAGVPPGGFGDAPLDELGRYAGAYPDAASLWGAPWLAPRLQALLGPKLGTFLASVHVKSPVMNDGGVFYVTGNRPHQGGLDGAVFVAEPDADAIEVVLFERGVREDFKEGGRDVAFPPEVVTALRNFERR